MLRLGTETGSLVNHVWSRTRPVGPEDVCEGMGATFLSWTDRHAATVHAVWSEGKKSPRTYISVREDNWRRTDKNGISEAQDYEFTPNPDGREEVYRWNGERWEGVYRNPTSGRWNKCRNYGLLLGQRSKFEDPSFCEGLTIT